MKETELYTRPNFPQYKKKEGIAGIFSFIFGILFWILLVIVSVVVIYTNWFANNLVYLINLFKNGTYKLPFWFSILMVIFVFPLTLFVVLVSTLIKIIRN